MITTIPLNHDSCAPWGPFHTITPEPHELQYLRFFGIPGIIPLHDPPQPQQLHYLRFFGARAAVCSVLLHGVKAGLKCLARRGGKRCSQAVEFCCEVRERVGGCVGGSIRCLLCVEKGLRLLCALGLACHCTHRTALDC